MKTNQIILESDYNKMLNNLFSYRCIQHNAKYCVVFGAINIHLNDIKTGGVKVIFNWRSYSYDGLCRVFDALKWENNMKTVIYHRNPTPQEVKFGEGAIHWIEIPKSVCCKKSGELKLWCKYMGERYYL